MNRRDDCDDCICLLHALATLEQLLDDDCDDDDGDDDEPGPNRLSKTVDLSMLLPFCLLLLVPILRLWIRVDPVIDIAADPRLSLDANHPFLLCCCCGRCCWICSAVVVEDEGVKTLADGSSWPAPIFD